MAAAAARHAAAFAFALLRRAEPDDFPQGARSRARRRPAGPEPPVPAEMLLRLAPPVALAFEWALPLPVIPPPPLSEHLVELGGQPATWLSRFRHRPPALFRGEGSAPLWVLVAAVRRLA